MPTFVINYDTTIRTLESRLSDLIDSGLPFDLERRGDVLNIEFDGGEKIVITPQSPLEQLWVSADFAGHRFVWSGSQWQEEKERTPLIRFLESILSRRLGTAIDLS